MTDLNSGIGFGDRLLSAMRERIPLCVGIDPHAALLSEWGLTDDVRGLESFAMRCVEELAETVAVLKPQAAFFERHGAAGFAVLERTIQAARRVGAIVILDAKRGDLGSTAAAYADAYLRPESPMYCDALTISPYLGFGSLQPMIDTAIAHQAGVFVLAETSNPEGAQVQRAVDASGRTVAQSIVDQAAQCNRRAGRGGSSLGSVGIVMGATIDSDHANVSDLGGPILVPGVGAQGATPSDVAALFDAGSTVVISTSRDVLRAGPGAGAMSAKAKWVGVEVVAVRNDPADG